MIWFPWSRSGARIWSWGGHDPQAMDVEEWATDQSGYRSTKHWVALMSSLNIVWLWVLASPFVGDNIYQIKWHIAVTPFFLSSPDLSSPCLELFEITICSGCVARLRDGRRMFLSRPHREISSFVESGILKERFARSLSGMGVGESPITKW
jgi:hypothetical protein